MKDINFFRQLILEKQNRNKKIGNIVLILNFVFVFVVLIYFIPYGVLKIYKNKYESLEITLSKFSNTDKQLEKATLFYKEAEERYRVLKDIDKTTIRDYKIIEKIHGEFSKNINIELMELERNQKLTIQGKGKEVNEISVFLIKLDHLKVFQDIYLTEFNIEEQNFCFKIDCIL